MGAPSPKHTHAPQRERGEPIPPTHRQHPEGGRAAGWFLVQLSHVLHFLTSGPYCRRACRGARAAILITWARSRGLEMKWRTKAMQEGDAAAWGDRIASNQRPRRIPNTQSTPITHHVSCIADIFAPYILYATVCLRPVRPAARNPHAPYSAPCSLTI